MTNSSNLNTFLAEQKEKGKKANRLLKEQSPYLLQHAFNPVDWYPWGEEAFARAKSEEKPIFLSIGYSTCHWCHVMAEESFENTELAEILNDNFVCIKVDREERPDIDHLYMTAVQSIAVRGGWPLNVFLTPDLKPFYGGTYFPPEDRQGIPGLKKTLGVVLEGWQNQNEKLLDTADRIIAHLEEINIREKGLTLTNDILDKCFAKFKKSYDKKFGGFDKAPKFPRPSVFNFLIRHHYSSGEKEALEITLDTLRKMAAGGIHDHLGGGFHRYSVDDQWRVPHFEKMLYDQAQLAISYLEIHQITGNNHHAAIARDIMDYVLRDLTGPAGGFYSAEDADSRDKDDPAKHGEGLFYLWQKTEIEAILGQKQAEIFNYHYGIKSEGNSLQDPNREFSGKNILYIEHSRQETAEYFRLSPEEVDTVLTESRKKLFETRNRRPRPHLDDKIITANNGLMLAAFARGARVLSEDRYLAAAERAASFIKENLYDKERGTLFRGYREGKTGLIGLLDDYAFLVYGLLELYEASFEPRWLKWALELTAKQTELFEDKEDGGFFSTSEEDDSILVRMKPGFDGAEPSGNSVAALNLIRLSRLTGNSELEEKGRRTIEAFSEHLLEYPPVLPQMLAAYNYLLAPPWQIMVVGPRDREDTRKMLDATRRKFLPHTAIIFIDTERKEESIPFLPPLFGDLDMVEGKATAHICKDFSCRLPITDARELEDKL